MFKTLTRAQGSNGKPEPWVLASSPKATTVIASAPTAYTVGSQTVRLSQREYRSLNR